MADCAQNATILNPTAKFLDAKPTLLTQIYVQSGHAPLHIKVSSLR